MKNKIRVFILFISIFFIWNCVAFNRKATPLINTVDKYLVPESTPGKILLSPIYIPTGIAGGIIDIFVLHPVLQIVPAAMDTYHLLWEPKFYGYFTEMGSVPVRLVVSPVFFGGIWIYLSVFDSGERNFKSGKVKESIPIETLIEQKDVIGIQEWIFKVEHLRNPEYKNSVETLLKNYSPSVHPEIHLNLVIKICDGSYEMYEDSLLGLIPQKDSSHLLYCLERYKTKKASRVIFNEISKGTLDDGKFLTYMQTLFKMGNTEDIRAIKEKLKK